MHMSVKVASWRWLISLACLLMVAEGQAMTRTEILPFSTVAMSDQQLLRGKGGEATGIAGVLKLPAERNNPVVVLLYGAGGYGDYVDDWVSLLNQHGIGTFVVDSTSGRIDGKDSEQGHMRQLAVIRDAYAALDMLAIHPGVDANRIALMGFSKAGQGALYASLERMQKLYGPANAKFAGIVAFYPNCSVRYRDDEQLIGSPVWIFHGEADEQNAFSSCNDYVKRTSAAGAAIQLVGYPGVRHGFDRPGVTSLSNTTDGSVAMSGCDIREEVKGLLINKATGRLFRFDDDCVHQAGPSRFDAAAFEDVKRKVPALFESLFGRIAAG